MKTFYELGFFLSLIFFSISVCAQRKPVYEHVQKTKSEGVAFKTLSEAFIEGKVSKKLLKQFIDPNEVSFLQYNNMVSSNLDATISLSIPAKGDDWQLELVEVPASFYNYQLVTSDGSKYNANRAIRHYRGIVKGDPNSLVAISFLEKEIMGIIATDKGNWNLTFDKPSNQHILYNDQNVAERPSFECDMDDYNSPRKLGSGLS